MFLYWHLLRKMKEWEEKKSAEAVRTLLGSRPRNVHERCRRCTLRSCTGVGLDRLCLRILDAIVASRVISAESDFQTTMLFLNPKPPALSPQTTSPKRSPPPSIPAPSQECSLHLGHLRFSLPQHSCLPPPPPSLHGGFWCQNPRFKLNPCSGKRRPTFTALHYAIHPTPCIPSTIG